MTDVSPPRHPSIADAEARAQDAFDAVQQDHAFAETELRAVLADTDASTRAHMIASWGLGRLLHDAGGVTEALDVYPHAVALAESLDRQQDEAQIRVSWSLCLHGSGDADAALEQLELAEPSLHGAALGRLLMQRGFLLLHAGATDAAVAELDRALPLLQADGDQLAEARLLSNRGVAQMHLGHVRGARADFESSAVLADRLGQHLISAGAQHNLGWLAGRLGDLPEALRQFELARERYIAHGSPGRVMAALDTDQCEVHLLAGLGEEARDVAQRLLVESGASGNVLQLGESHLTMARAQLLLGSRREAAEHADRAAALFRSSERPPWEALATYVGVMARADGAGAAGDAPASELGTLRDVAGTLDRLGWSTEAAEVRVLLGRLAIAAGRLDEARADLERAAETRYNGRPTQRIEAWHATALLRAASGDRRGAKHAVSHGLRIVDRHRATLGATELRVRASAHGADLAALGLRLALATRRPKDVLVAAERWRAGATTVTHVEGGGDHDDVAVDLAELRRLDGELRDGVLAGGAAEDAGTRRLRGSIDALERTITRRARLREGDPRAMSTRLELPVLRRALGRRTLVEYVEVDGTMFAVTVSPQRSRLVELCPTARVVELVDHLAFAVRRLATLPEGHPGVDAASRSFADATTALDESIARPLRLPADHGVVVVPPARLQLLPWTALNSYLGTGEVVLAPSAAWWLQATSRRQPLTEARVLAVDGGELPAAEAELQAISALHPTAVLLRGDDATCERVLEEMARADIVHLAAHGRFRADNPMFSSIRFVDGPLMVHDLEQLDRAPALVVLASCHAGRGTVFAGDELLGTAAALTSLGVVSVVAPTVAVRDDLASGVAVALHRSVRHGSTASAALCAITARAVADGRPGEAAVAAAFQCIGSEAELDADPAPT